jgi:hypothetical protein
MFNSFTYFLTKASKLVIVSFKIHAILAIHATLAIRAIPATIAILAIPAAYIAVVFFQINTVLFSKGRCYAIDCFVFPMEKIAVIFKNSQF